MRQNQPEGTSRANPAFQPDVAALDGGDVFCQIPGINDMVSFHGRSVDEIKKQFAIALDSYLSDYEEMGKEPERSYSGILDLRLTPEFHRTIAFEAEASGMSINDVVVASLERSCMQ